MKSLMLTPQYFKQQMQQMHQHAPLVHCMTNDVAANFTANVLLAIGASPAMVVALEESAEFAQIASALNINVGTLTVTQASAMGRAVRSACQNEVPWVLDPVAFGALAYRTKFCLELLEYNPTVIRGNASEIAALSGEKLAGKGADSLISSHDALACAQQVAQKYKTVVAMTGETDYVTDGSLTYALNNGHIQLTRVTATGCALSAMVAAYCAVCETPMLAALCALSHMAIAGEIAASQTNGVGSFAVCLLDQLQLLAAQWEGDTVQHAILPLRCQKL